MVEKLYNETLKYLGKTLKKEGSTDKGPWKLWELQFDCEGMYPWKCSCFDTLSPKSEFQVKDLEEGSYYEIVFKLEDYVGKYGKNHSKKVILFKKGDESKKTKGVSHKEQAVNTVQTQPLTPLSDWNTFAEGYDKAMSGNDKKCDLHMLGAYVANVVPQQFEDIINKCKKHFEQ